MAAAAIAADPVVKMVCFMLAAFGTYASLPVFWTLPSAFLSGASAAVGIAAINAFANLSGFSGPYVMGWIKTSTGEYTGGLLLVAAIAGVATLIVLGMAQRHFPAASRVPGIPGGVSKSWNGKSSPCATASRNV